MTVASVIIIVKYIVAIMIIVGIVMTPAWLARKTNKSKNAMGIIRISSWLFGWTGVGWLVALILAAKK